MVVFFLSYFVIHSPITIRILVYFGGNHVPKGLFFDMHLSIIGIIIIILVVRMKFPVRFGSFCSFFYVIIIILDRMNASTNEVSLLIFSRCSNCCYSDSTTRCLFHFYFPSIILFIIMDSEYSVFASLLFRIARYMILDSFDSLVNA